MSLIWLCAIGYIFMSLCSAVFLMAVTIGGSRYEYEEEGSADREDGALELRSAAVDLGIYWDRPVV